MTRPRPALRVAADPAEADLPGIRQSVRVSTAAAALDMNERDVRKLLKTGQLEGHGTGKRGVRIYVDSIAAYQQRRPIDNRSETGAAHRDAERRDTDAAPKPNAPRQPAYREALGYLAKHGID